MTSQKSAVCVACVGSLAVAELVSGARREGRPWPGCATERGAVFADRVRAVRSTQGKRARAPVKHTHRGDATGFCPPVW